MFVLVVVSLGETGRQVLPTKPALLVRPVRLVMPVRLVRVVRPVLLVGPVLPVRTLLLVGFAFAACAACWDCAACAACVACVACAAFAPCGQEMQGGISLHCFCWFFICLGEPVRLVLPAQPVAKECEEVCFYYVFAVFYELG